ncbi:MAG: sugar phosphate isomerase/epimerase [Planctomycetes bacterium]|nr:sugar phosphate isomerase/epimerase [Planctomycetota bacterium]
MLKISFSTLACPEWDWHDVVNHGSQAGYDGVEIRLLTRETDLLKIGDLQPSQWPARQQEMRDAGFRVAGLASSVRFDAPDANDRRTQIDVGRRYIDLCSALGGEFIRVFGDVLPNVGDPLRPAVIQQVADGLVELGTMAAPAGIQILLETHGDFSASPPCVEVMQLANHPNVGLVWDTHHPWRFHGERLADTWERLRRWTRHTHWKDSVRIPDRGSTPEAIAAASAASQLMAGHQHADYVLFRGGEFPARECLQLLRKGGYSGWHSLEWEKMWHPELLGPEIALPLFPIKLRELELDVTRDLHAGEQT